MDQKGEAAAPAKTRLNVAITTKFSMAEAEQLKARAEAAGVPLRTYIRRSVLSGGDLSPDTALVITEVGRLRELLTRLWAASTEAPMDGHSVAEIVSKVDAIDARLFVARATGGRT